MNRCAKRAVQTEKGTCGDIECKRFVQRFADGSNEEKKAIETYEELISANDSENAVLWYFTTIVPMSLCRKVRARRIYYSELSASLIETQRSRLASCKRSRVEEDLTAESPPSKLQ
jgi:hypothetical protein